MKGWKTVLFGVLLGIIGAFSTPEMQAYVSTNLPWLAPILGGIVIGLRAITDSSIFKDK